MAAQAAAAFLGVAVVPRLLVIDELRTLQQVDAFPHQLHSRFENFLSYPPARNRYPPLMAFRAWLTATASRTGHG